MPALQPYIIEPIWEQFKALLPERETNHPLGCHKPRISERVVFEKLVQVLVFGCAYWRIAEELCSESTLRRRRDEWIELGVDKGKGGIKRSTAVDAGGIPLGTVTAPDHDLLTEALRAVGGQEDLGREVAHRFSPPYSMRSQLKTV